MKVCLEGRNGHGGLAILEIGEAEFASAEAVELDRKLDRQEAITTAGTNEGDRRRADRRMVVEAKIIGSASVSRCRLCSCCCVSRLVERRKLSLKHGKH